MDLNIKIGASEEEIKEATKKLSDEIALRQFEIEQLRLAIGVYRKQCKHTNQKKGYNERDGSWGNPCPVCGYSY